MSALGDSFPEHDRYEYAKRHFLPGQILYLWCDFTNPPKDKFLLLVCTEERPLLFIINSRINEYLEKRPELFACQITLEAREYDFLSHDSFLDCSNVVDVMDRDDIIGQIASNPIKAKGKLNSATREEVIKVVEKALTISPYHKKLILRSLSSR